MTEEVLRRRDGWRVETIDFYVATALVREFHYSGSTANTATERHGLISPSGDVVGAALWIPPTKNAALSVSENWQGVLCNSRLAVHPDCPKNAASFLLGRSMSLIDRERWPTFLTYADSNQGHTGAIYRATNWTYVGVTPAGDVWTHSVTGEQRGRKRGPRTWLSSEMIEAGYVKNPPGVKHKFVHRSSARPKAKSVKYFQGEIDWN